MPRTAISYSTHPVDFDADQLCERCELRHATQYIASTLPIYRNKYRAEVCDDCLQAITAKLSSQPTWSLLED